MSAIQQALLATTPASSTDPAATAWAAAVVSAGGTVSGAELSLISTLISGLKSDGTWSLLDRMWVAGENITQFLVDLKANALMTNHGGVYTASRGMDYNGTTTYTDSGFNPSTSGVNFTQNSAHIMVYTSVFNSAFVFGCNDNVSNDDALYCPYTDTNFYPRVNSPFTQGAVTPGATKGSWIGDRTNSTTVVPNVNQTDLASFTQASTARINFNMYVGLSNQGGTATALGGGASSRCGALSVGGALGSTAGRNALASRVLTYLTAIGAN